MDVWGTAQVGSVSRATPRTGAHTTQGDTRVTARFCAAGRVPRRRVSPAPHAEPAPRAAPPPSCATGGGEGETGGPAVAHPTHAPPPLQQSLLLLQLQRQLALLRLRLTLPLRPSVVRQVLLRQVHTGLRAHATGTTVTHHNTRGPHTRTSAPWDSLNKPSREKGNATGGCAWDASLAWPYSHRNSFAPSS